MSKTVLSPLLNEELIKRALQSYHNVNNASAFIVKACNFKLSSANGDNFCSEIYQVDVQYELNGNAEKQNFIVKIMIPEIAEIGSNEKEMFNIVLPAMEKCLNVVEGENENKLYAKCLISEANKREEFYVLENLNSLGYYCADRIKGLDLQHALVLMRKIAKFHAASMLYAKQFPQVVKSLRASHFEKGASDVIAQAITFGGFEYVGNMIKNWPKYEALSERVHAVIPKFNQLVMEVVNSNNSKFNVINHGDLWVNNFLYKYDIDSGRPIDVLFVDFQNCFWGSCGFDINWFLNTSLELQVLRENRLQLIQTYYDVLQQTLEKENYPASEIPSLEDVLMEIRRSELIGLYTSLCELPIVALEKSKSQGFDCNTFGQPEKMKEIRVLMYDNERVKDILEYTLKYYEEINML
ncbi:uncharacterized protein LOC135955053 [Calliphora vicina]|uniref:uncharacterized protein LOC135955053 n=1 Tax=Calliphora vicina TaxID=7373 RepID=UPI00325C15FE